MKQRQTSEAACRIRTIVTGVAGVAIGLLLPGAMDDLRDLRGPSTPPPIVQPVELPAIAAAKPVDEMNLDEYEAWLDRELARPPDNVEEWAAYRHIVDRYLAAAHRLAARGDTLRDVRLSLARCEAAR